MARDALIAQGGTVYAAYQTASCNGCGYTIDVTALNGATGAKNMGQSTP